MPAAMWDKSSPIYSIQAHHESLCGGNAKQGGLIIFIIIIITPGVGEQQGEVWENGNPVLSVGHVCVYIYLCSGYFLSAWACVIICVTVRI